MIRPVIESYRASLAFLAPFLATHVFVRLVSAAILLPTIGLLLRLTIGFSDQSALTDQDIARFLLTPAGAVGGLLVLALFVAALVLDVALMTATLRSRETRPMAALRAGVGFAIGHFTDLARFGFALLLRVLGLSLPFIILGATIFFTQLTQFDINYYLTNRPPEFLLWGGVIAVAVLTMLLVLLRGLLGWALAMHLMLFGKTPTSDAFRKSRSGMAGRKGELLASVALWFAVRLALGAVVGAVTAFFLVLAPGLFPDSLTGAAAAVIAVLGVSLVVTTVVNALANGALADLLNDHFEFVTGGTVAAFDSPSVASHTPRLRSAAMLGLVAVALISLGSVGFGVALAERISADAEVEIIGHRGAAASRPENTMASVEKAIEDGADWVEIDVQETADGQVIVAHDSDFMKSAGVELKVWDATMDDIARIDIGSWFDPAYADQRTPLLRDVLLAAKDRSKVIIELKYYGHDVDLENRVAAIVDETGMQDQIATMSLKYPAVQKMRQIRPEWRSGVLAATAIGDLSGLEGDFLAVSLTQVSPRLLARARDAGKDVYVWTVNDAATMSRMISMGVDGLITDEPALAAHVITERNALPTSARLALWIADTFGVAADRMLGEPVTQ